MTPRERRAALVIFVLLLPCLAALFWSAHLAGQVARPGALRSFSQGGADHAAFFFADALHLLDAQGERVGRQPLAALGLRQEPTDMDWSVDASGKVQAWMFEDAPPRIVRCELQPAPMQLTACAEAMAGPQLKARAASSAVHLAVDQAQGRLFVADAQGDTVRAFSLQGQPLGESAARELSFPNRLRVAGEQLAVADNDNRRLAWFGIAGAQPAFPVLRILPLANHPQGARRKAADFAFQRSVGIAPAGLWVLAVAQGQKNGQVLLFDGEGAPRGVGDLGGHQDPLIIDRLGDALLAADFDGIALYRVGADGRFLGSFGSGAFSQELAAARRQAQQARWWKWGGWAGLALTLLVGFGLVFRLREKR